MSRYNLLAHPEWRALEQGLPVIRRFFEGDPHAHGLSALMEAVAIYMDRLVGHLSDGEPVVWYNLGFGGELVYALGQGEVMPLPVETIGALHNLLGNLGTSLELIDVAEAAGVPSDSCSADKIGVGAAHRGLYPLPACTIGINTPCDAQVAATQTIAEISGRPMFVVDVPYGEDEQAVQHVARQLRQTMGFLEQHTGKRIDPDRLREVCAISNQTVEAIWEWLDWRRAVPLTQSSKLVAFNFILHILWTGSDLGLMAAQGMAREARERTERGEAFFEERVRAVWYQDPMWIDMQMYDWFERELGLTVPIDCFGFYSQDALIDTTTVDTMLTGLAHKLINQHPMSRQFRGDFPRYLRDFVHMHRTWSADCGIFAGHIGCKHAWGGIGLFKEACRKRDIPLLVFEFDMFDPRVTSPEDIYFEVERFVNEIVWPRKQRALAKARREAG